MNIENLGTHLTNEAGTVWILGYKTERGGTLAHTLAGGRTEILGGFSYTTTGGKLAPMFINNRTAKTPCLMNNDSNSIAQSNGTIQKERYQGKPSSGQMFFR